MPTGPKVDPDRHPLAKWRKEQGLSLRGLAEESGVPFPTLSRIESAGQIPHGRTIKAIAVVIRKRTPDVDPLEILVPD